MTRTSKLFSLATAGALVLAGSTFAQTGTRTGGGSPSGLGSSGLGSSGLGSSGLGSSGLGSSGLGSSGLGSSGLGSSGLGSSGLGSSGSGGSFGGSSGTGMGFGNTGTGGLYGNTGATGSGGFSGSTFGGNYGRGGVGGNAANVAASAGRYPGIASSNLFSSSYASPLGQGLPSGTGTTANARFGSPLYAATTSSTSLTTGTAGTMSSSLSNMSNSSSTNMARPIYQPPGNPYIPQPMPMTNLQPQGQLQQLIKGSSYLSPKNAVQVVGNGSLVVLRGTAVSDYERQLVEAMVSLAPGVNEIRNEITVQGAGTGGGQ